MHPQELDRPDLAWMLDLRPEALKREFVLLCADDRRWLELAFERRLAANLAQAEQIRAELAAIARAGLDLALVPKNSGRPPALTGGQGQEDETDGTRCRPRRAARSSIIHCASGEISRQERATPGLSRCRANAGEDGGPAKTASRSSGSQGQARICPQCRSEVYERASGSEA